MNSSNSKDSKPEAANSFFDCTKMKSLIDEKEPVNFAERFRNWLTAYTKNSQQKIWRDVEYFQGH